MLKKEIFVPVILVIVGMAFVVISVLVYFSKGNAKLIKQKLKLGAIIIGITATATSCFPPDSCYAPPPPRDMFSFDTNKSPIIVKLPKDSMITGKIYTRSKTQYSFMIQDTQKVEIYRDNIIPEDGSFNSNTERFIIKIPLTIDTGKYILKVYTTDKTTINPAISSDSRWIKITK